MRTGPASACAGYYHETAFYGSDDEFVAIVEPFVRGGVDSGEPTMVACRPDHAELLHRSIDCAGVRFLSGADQYASPGQTIHSYRALFADLIAAGAQQIRVVGDVPHPGTGAEWSAWARYEAAVNYAYDEFPIWGLCPYDTRITPVHVLDDVACTHPYVGGTEGHRRNDRFVDPMTFSNRITPAAPDPLERDAPALEFSNAAVPDVRTALRRLDAELIIGRDEAENLIVAVSEIVSNAYDHGVQPVVVRVWTGTGRIVAKISDQGPGPENMLVGLLPPPRDGARGRGMWIAHQLCGDVQFARDDGFHVRLAVSRPILGAA